jgi:hypothetical protein
LLTWQEAGKVFFVPSTRGKNASYYSTVLGLAGGYVLGWEDALLSEIWAGDHRVYVAQNSSRYLSANQISLAFLACFAAQGIARWSHRRSYALENGMLKKHTSAYTCYLLVLTVSEIFSVSYEGRR